MATTQKHSRFRRDRAISENAFTTLFVGLDLKSNQPILIRQFKPETLEHEAEWVQFCQQLDERRKTQVPGLLPVAAIAGSRTSPFLVILGSDGRSLRQVLSGPEPADLRELVHALNTAAGALDELSRLGYAHGDVRPDTLFFNAEGQLCLNEISSHYALCGWNQQTHDVNPRFIGSVFPSTHVAPEIRAGGPLSDRTDQYALGLVLLELCSGVRPHDGINPLDTIAGQGVAADKQRRLARLRPVLSRALSPDPARRFGSSAELVAAAEKELNKVSVGKWVGITGTAALLLCLAWLFFFSGESAVLSADEKLKLQQEIAEQYVMDISPIADVALIAGLSNLDPSQTTSVDPVLQAVRQKMAESQSAQDQEQWRALLNGLTVSLNSTANRAANARSFQFLYPAQGGKTYLDLDANNHWPFEIQLGFSQPLDQAVELVWGFYDGNDVPLTSEQKKTLPAGGSTITLSGQLAPPQGKPNWAVGSEVRVKTWAIRQGLRHPWKDSTTFRVGDASERSETVKLVPANVQAQGYEVATKTLLKDGENFRLTVSGSIRPGSDEIYKLFIGKSNRPPIGPEGISVGPGAQNYFLVSKQRFAKWGALILRIGPDGGWTPPTLTLAGNGTYTAAEQAPATTGFSRENKLYVSIDSVTHKRNLTNGRPDPIGAAETRFWQSDNEEEQGGAFHVTIHTLDISPPDVPTGIASELRQSFGY